MMEKPQIENCTFSSFTLGVHCCHCELLMLQLILKIFPRLSHRHGQFSQQYRAAPQMGETSNLAILHGSRAELQDALSIGRGQALAWDVLCPTGASGFWHRFCRWVLFAN